MIEIMKNTPSPKRKRKGPEPKITPNVLREIVYYMPARRMGRTEYLRAKARELNVTLDAIYKAKQRLSNANH